jgi:hypothetical protein
MIEQNFKRIADALERIAAALEVQVPAALLNEAPPRLEQTAVAEVECVGATVTMQPVKKRGRPAAKKEVDAIPVVESEAVKPTEAVLVPATSEPLEVAEEKSIVSISDLKAEAAKSEEAKPVARTIDDVREALKSFAVNNGADKAKAVLGRFNVTKISDLPQERYFDLLVDLEQSECGL